MLLVFIRLLETKFNVLCESILSSKVKYLVTPLEEKFGGYQITVDRVNLGKFDQSVEEDVNQTLWMCLADLLSEIESRNYRTCSVRTLRKYHHIFSWLY